MNAVWKYIATGALSMLLTLVCAWATVNAQAVTKTQVQEMIQPDRETLRELRDDVKDLKRTVEQLDREIGELRGMMRTGLHP